MFIKKKLFLWLLYMTMSRPPSRFPPSFKTCNRRQSQSDFNACLKEAGTIAVRQLNRPYQRLGLPSLRTVSVGDLKVPLRSGGLEQEFENLVFDGFTNATFERFEVDFEDGSVLMEILFPEMKADFDYNFYGIDEGRSFYGKGHGGATFEDLRFFFTSSFEVYQKMDLDYFRLKNSKISVDTGSIKFRLGRLYENGIDATDEFNKESNNNWRERFLAARPKLEEVFGNVFLDVLGSFLATVPAVEMVGE